MPNNKLIAQNTIYLFVRLALTIIVTLYTSRIVLQVLGITDFGVYNVVAGFVSMLAFFQSSLSNATQRFLNLALGHGSVEKAREVFCQSFWLYSVFALILFGISEIFGGWFLNTQLNIPKERLYAANIVFHFSIMMSLVQIIQIPYNAIIIAREKMRFYAYITLFDVLFKLLLAFAMLYVEDVDKLTLYSILLFLSSTITFVVYVWYCRANFPESELEILWIPSLAKDMIKFLGQNIYSCAVWLIGSQGYNIILNIYFGASINSARGIAIQANGALVRFSDNILVASRPQITKSYATGDIKGMISIIEFCTKVSVCLYLIIAVPIFRYIDDVLHLWLVDVPEYTNIFLKLMLIDSLICLLFMPLCTVSMSTGDVKRSLVYGKSMSLIMVPLSWLFYKIGFSDNPCLVFYALIITDLLYLIYILYDVFVQIKMNVKLYLGEIIIPFMLISISATVMVYIVSGVMNDSFFSFVTVSMLSAIVVTLSCYIFVLTPYEKERIKTIIKKCILKR